jgi:secreted trypsin-like serine protease
MTRIIIINKTAIMMVLLFLLAAPSAVHSLDGTADFFSIISDVVEGQGTFRCGGSLIHQDIVVTASYCSVAGDIIRVGYKNDDTSLAIRTAKVVFNHPEAGNNQENFPNDIAIVKLNASVTHIAPIVRSFASSRSQTNQLALVLFLGRSIRKGPLTVLFMPNYLPHISLSLSTPPPPNPHQTLNTNMVNPRNKNQTVYMAHAGAVPDVAPTFTIGTLPLTGKFSTEVQMPILYTYPFRLCYKEYRMHRTSYKSDPQKDVQFCARVSPTQGPCDSAAWGSPMWDMVGGYPVLVGMASQGSCTPGNPPYLFTRIFTYLAWIQGQICALSDYPPDYCFEEP